jgi:hypothetical protein
MAQGDGSITEIKQPNGKSYSPKHWRVAVSFGTDPLTSKRLKAQRNVRGTKSDACKVRNQLLEDFRNGLNPNAANTTFGDFANQWHKNRVAAEAVTKTRLKREETMVRDLCERHGLQDRPAPPGPLFGQADHGPVRPCDARERRARSRDYWKSVLLWA